ncbi:MAG: hypothetical protein OEY86_13735 [Nitrospira sp.]|nr:hypothetical protein [Nitrospira sp.]
MKYLAVAMFALMVVGCASDPARRAAVAEEEVGRLAPPTRALSEFRDYELKPIAMSSGVMADEAKVDVSKDLGSRITTRVTPLLDRWRAKKSEGAEAGVLIIEPKVQELRVISAAARFFLGYMMGDSFVDIDVRLTDSATGQVIAIPRIRRSASAWGGTWSIGMTDQNLLDYITDIVHRYLEVHYTAKGATGN